MEIQSISDPDEYDAMQREFQSLQVRIAMANAFSLDDIDFFYANQIRIKVDTDPAKQN